MDTRSIFPFFFKQKWTKIVKKRKKLLQFNKFYSFDNNIVKNKL